MFAIIHVIPAVNLTVYRTRASSIYIRTAAAFAVAMGDIEILEFLIENDIDLNIANNEGITPLMLAAMQVFMHWFYYMGIRGVIDFEIFISERFRNGCRPFRRQCRSPY